MQSVLLKGRACKVVIPLESETLAKTKAPDDKRTSLHIKLEGRTIVAEVATKSLRRAIATIAEHGAAGVTAFVQGKLMPDDIVEEAGLIALPKIPKAPATEAAA